MGFLKGEKFSSIGLMDRTPRMERPTMREQINVFYCRCDHQYPSCKSGLWSVPTVNQSCDKERNLHFLEEVYQMGSGFPRRRMVDSYHSRRFPLFHLKIRAYFTQFTNTQGKILRHILITCTTSWKGNLSAHSLEKG